MCEEVKVWARGCSEVYVALQRRRVKEVSHAIHFGLNRQERFQSLWSWEIVVLSSCVHVNVNRIKGCLHQL